LTLLDDRLIRERLQCFAEETDSVSALGAAVCWSMEAREEGEMFRVGRLVSFHSTPK
jgi:hypothetical protein